MPVDQPANPRIRTKVKQLDEDIDEAFFAITEDLRAGKFDVHEYQLKTLELLERYELRSRLAEDIEIARNADDQHWLVRRHVEHCRYTMLFFRVDDGEVHPPHQHYNLISTQIVIEGKVHLREYQRQHINEQGQLVARLVRDEIIGPGDAFQASEWNNNVHWFCAVDGPAILFNINARGYEEKAFDEREDGPFGRRYLDPTGFQADGSILCEHFDEAEGERRFQGKPLTDFPVAGSSAPQYQPVSIRL